MMRVSCLYLSSVLFAAGDVSFEEAYGPAPPNADMDNWFDRGEVITPKSIADAYHQMRLPETCDFPLEVVIVQDATASFGDDIVNMRNVQIPEMFNHLRALHPDTKFSVVSFRDKPIGDLGDARVDYCERFEMDGFSDRLEDITAAYTNIRSNGGMDPPENQMGALLAVAQSQHLWRDSNRLATKLIVISTDSNPHFADDGKNKYGMKESDGVWDEAEPATQCLSTYYPTADHVKDALVHRTAYLAQLVFDANWQNGLPKRAWEWFNNYIGQTPDFLEAVENDSSNFWQKLSLIIKQIEEVECPPISSTETETTQTETTETTETSTETETSTVSSSTVSSSTDPCPLDTGVVIHIADRPKKMEFWAEGFDGAEITAKIIEH